MQDIRCQEAVSEGVGGKILKELAGVGSHWQVSEVVRGRQQVADVVSVQWPWQLSRCYC